jgi:hypothetical protein
MALLPTPVSITSSRPPPPPYTKHEEQQALQVLSKKYGTADAEDRVTTLVKGFNEAYDRLTQEQSLQKDTKKAERLASRIAQILDQLRKDFNKIKNFLGNYNFTNTIGQDSSCADECANDLSTATDTRRAWKRELENMLTMVWHYVDAQHLGDYSLLHQPEAPAVDPTCGSSDYSVNCCKKVYRPYFHYYTPDGDCLSMATAAGGHSGNADTVAPSGNYNDAETRGCVLGFKNKDAMSPAAEIKTEPTSLKHTQITNKDMEIRQLWRLLVGEQGGIAKHRDAWWSFLVANSMNAFANDANNIATEGDLKDYFDNNICLPATMSDLLAKADIADDATTGVPVYYQTVYGILLSFADSTASTSGGNPLTNKLVAPPVADSYATAASRDANITDSGVFDEALKHAPTVCNVEDEPDLQFIMKLVVCVMENVRSCQINNDREMAVIEYVRETSECNEAYHQDVFSEMTSIDDSELSQRYTVGKEMGSDLDALYKENCVTKQTSFNDATLDGCCW